MKNDRNSGEISPEYDLCVGEMGKNYAFWGKKNSNMSWILPILWKFVFHEMPNSCIFKKS